jgi:DNA-binding transcriptional MerR regulator
VQTGGVRNKHLLAGEFAVAARLSSKALRLYAEQGLLLPASVDPVSGYRLYDPDQLPRARLIGRLRRIGLPLARIGFLVELEADARALELRAWLRTQRDLLEETAAEIEALDAGPDAGLVAAVALREVPMAKVLCRARRIDYTALADFVAESQRRIREHLRASHVGHHGTMLVSFQELVTTETEGLVEVAVVFEGTVEPVDDLYPRCVPAHTEAYLPVPSEAEDLPRILRVYDAVEAWIDHRLDLAVTDHPYEIYPGTGAFFDVAYPVSKGL